MTGKRLLTAIGEIDDRFITAAAPAKAPRRLWIRWCAVAACLCLVVAAGIALWQNGLFNQSEPILPPDGHGGDDNHDYSYAYLQKLYSVSGELIDWLEQQGKDFDAWSEERIEEIKSTKYNVASPAEIPLLLDTIETFDIPRAVIEKINDEQIKIDQENGWYQQIYGYAFTAEELDALYSADPAAITKFFASPYAVVAGDRAFAPRFYLNATQEELNSFGITREMIAPKITLLRRARVIEDAYPTSRIADIESALPYLRKLYSLAAVEELCPGDLQDWAEQKWIEITAKKFPFFSSDAAPLLLIAIEEFQISKAEFERINRERITYYEQRNEPYFIANSCFTQEEIDILYSGDQDAILRAFASPYALIIGDEACAPDFYLNATEAGRRAHGITAEMVEKKKPLLRTHGII